MRLPQLWLLADGATTADAGCRIMRHDAPEDSLFEAAPEAAAQDDRAKDDRGRHEQQ